MMSSLEEMLQDCQDWIKLRIQHLKRIFQRQVGLMYQWIIIQKGQLKELKLQVKIFNSIIISLDLSKHLNTIYMLTIRKEEEIKKLLKVQIFQNWSRCLDNHLWKETLPISKSMAIFCLHFKNKDFVKQENTQSRGTNNS